MRLFFFLLLLANLTAVLLMQAARHGSTEPERLALQVNAERVTVVDPASRPKAVPAAPVEPGKTAQAAVSNAPVTPPATAGAGGCVEIGDFNALTAASFEQELSRLSHTGIPQRRVVQAAPSQLVYLPPQGGEAEASRRLAQLREMGFSDSAVIREEAARRWGISLGRFTRTELAEAHLEKLRAAGVNDARIGEYPANSTRFAYRLPGVDAASGARLAAAAANFAGVTMRRCP